MSTRIRSMKAWWEDPERYRDYSARQVGRLLIGGVYVMHSIRIVRHTTTRYVVHFTFDAISEYKDANELIDDALRFHYYGHLPTDIRVYTNTEYERLLNNRENGAKRIAAKRARMSAEERRAEQRRNNSYRSEKAS